MTETTVAVMEPQGRDVGLVKREEALSQTVADIEARIGAITIGNEGEYKEAAQLGRLVKRRTADVKAFWKPLKTAAHRAHAEICKREAAMLQPLTNAEKALREAMGAYVSEQERLSLLTEEAARKAAREEADRKLQEAIELEAKGDKVTAAAVIEEAEIMSEMSSAVSVAVSPKAEGVTTKKDWEIESIDDRCVPVMVDGAELRPVDTSAVMKLIRSTKGQVHIPGVVYREVTKVAFRK